MEFLKRIFNYITTRYTKVQILVILAVIVFGFLASDASIFSRMAYDVKIRELNNEIESYQKQIIEDRSRLEKINDDKEQVEKFAREQYLMKKPNEDIFIIE